MNQVLLIKHRDIFERPPNANNYYAMLLRCGGEIPLNICATIASVFSSGKGLVAQESLERELLSDSIKNRVRRLRRNKIGDATSVVFTRAGALLNLKCLLSLNRPSKYSATAVGAVSLHANDYVDIDLPRAEASLLMVEMMPVWELYNPRDVGGVLRRYYYIYHDILAADTRVVDLFTTDLTATPAELRIDGLKIDDYLALLFGLYTAAATSAESLKTSIIDFSDPVSAMGISTDEAHAFLSARGIDQATIRASIGAIENPSEFAAALLRPGWATDFSIFRTHPLVKLGDGRLLVADLQYLIENAAAGLFWNTFFKLSKAARDLFLSYWGDAFEIYVKRLIRTHFDARWTIIENLKGSDFEIDVLAIREDVALVIECKAGMLNHAIKTSRNFAKVTHAIDTKLVTNEKGRPKGIGQLVRSCNAIARGEVSDAAHVRRIYPLLVVDDPVFSTPGTNTYLAERFATMKPEANVFPPTVATIDEFEEVTPYIGACDLTVPELLDDRFSPEGVHATPLHNTFMAVAGGRVKVRRNQLTASAGDRLHKLIIKKFEKLASRGTP